MPIPLEDTFADILGKAQRGLNLSDSELASRAGITPEVVQHLRDGHFSVNAALLAPILGLDARALMEIGANAYHPAEIGPFEGLLQFNTPFGDMHVNAYLAWDPVTKDAVAFDTGGDCSPMLEKIDSLGLTLRHILLTHTHGDHIYDLDRLIQKTHAPAYVSSREPIAGATSIEAGREFWVGRLRIGTRLTWGHSKGGLTFVLSGLTHPIAVVGDALFAGSMGGGMASYPDALRTNRDEIFSLPTDTIICPGHGPMTTVGQEKSHNPFFAKSN
jgi:hydroxyacylglutathione hydrolase